MPTLFQPNSSIWTGSEYVPNSTTAADGYTSTDTYLMIDKQLYPNFIEILSCKVIGDKTITFDGPNGNGGATITVKDLINYGDQDFWGFNISWDPVHDSNSSYVTDIFVDTSTTPYTFHNFTFDNEVDVICGVYQGEGINSTGYSGGWQHLDFNDNVSNGQQLDYVSIQFRGGPVTLYLELYETDTPKHITNPGAHPSIPLSGETHAHTSSSVLIDSDYAKWYNFQFSNVPIDINKYYYIWVKKDNGSSNASIYMKSPSIVADNNEIHGGAGGNAATLNHSATTSLSNSAPTIIGDVNIIKNSDKLQIDTSNMFSTNDDDGDVVTLSYVWKKNGVTIDGETNSELDISEAITGDNISVTVTVTPNDGTSDGQSVESNVITINQIDDLTINKDSQDFADEVNNIILTSPDSGTVIYYTLDGSTPNEQSTQYINPITISGSTTTLQAIGYKDGFSPSEVLTKTYTKLTQYTITNYTMITDIKTNTSIELSSDGFDENIYYTLDGSDPDENSLLFSNSIKIRTTGNVTLKFIAIGSLLTNSVIGEYTYNVTDWLDNQNYSNISNTKKTKISSWINDNTANDRTKNALELNDISISNEKTEWNEIKSVLRDAIISNEINNGDVISFIPKNKEKTIKTKIFFDASALTQPATINEIIEHSIGSNSNFYIPLDDTQDNNYWAKITIQGQSINIKFSYVLSTDVYSYNLIDEDLNDISDPIIIDNDTQISIGSVSFNLFTGGIGGENDLQLNNIDDVITLFNCAIKTVMVEYEKLDALNKILCLRELLVKNKKRN